MGIMWPCLGLSHFSIPNNDSCCERLFPSCEARLFLNKYYMLCKIDYLLPTIHDDSGLVYYYRGLAFVSLLNLQAIESGNGKLDWTADFILVDTYSYITHRVEKLAVPLAPASRFSSSQFPGTTSIDATRYHDIDDLCTTIQKDEAVLKSKVSEGAI